MWYLTEKNVIKNSTLDKEFRLSPKKAWIVKLLLKNKNDIVTHDNIIRFAELASKGSLRSHVQQMQRDLGLPILIIPKHGYMWKE